MSTASVTSANAGTVSAAPPRGSSNAADTQDRFLKLLVAQMKNQDPMNPMENAEVTSQMAQIQSVTALGSVNASIQALSTQMSQLQAMQGANLLGRQVSLEGNRLVIDQGQAQGGFELSGAAASVKVEILSAAGTVIDTISLENQSAGRHNFSWPTDKPGGGNAVAFRVSAANGSTKISANPVIQDKVSAINANGGKLELQLQHLGTVAYSDIKTIN